MVAMVAGLLLVAAVISLFATILKANYTAMQTSRLNREVPVADGHDGTVETSSGRGMTPAPPSFLPPASGSRSGFYFDTATDLMNETATGFRPVYL